MTRSEDEVEEENEVYRMGICLLLANCVNKQI